MSRPRCRPSAASVSVALVASAALGLAACGAADGDPARVAPPAARGAALASAPAPAPAPAPAEGTVSVADGALAVRVEWLGGAPRAGEDASLRLSFVHADGAAARDVQVASVAFEPVGDGAPCELPPEVDDVAAQPKHVVEISGLCATRPGAWMLRLSATVDGVVRAVQMPVQVL